MATSDLEPWIDLGVTTASTAAAGVSAYLSPEVGVALTALQPVVAEVVRRGVNRVFGLAIAGSGLSPSEMVERLSAHAEGETLLLRALEAARTTAHDEKLRVLGRCLASATADGSRVDQELLLVAAVAALEPPHMRLLSVIAQPFTISGDGPESVRELDRWNAAGPQLVDPNLTPELVEALLGVLVAQGLAIEVSDTFGGGYYKVTDLGRLLLDRASETVAGSHA